MDKLIIFEAGLEEYREFWMKGLARHYELILLQPWDVSWERPFISTYVKCHFHDWDVELKRLTVLFQMEGIRGVIALNEGTVNFALDLQKALHLPEIHTLQNPAVVRNKILMRKHLHESGLPSARTFEDQKEVVFPVIVKPSEFMSSMGVSLVREHSELSRKIEEARTIDIPEENLRLHYRLSEQVVVEEYIEGEEFSIECWVVRGKLLSWQLTK